MKKWPVVVLVAALVLSGFAYGGAPKAQKQTIVGTAVEFSTYAMMDESDETYIASQQTRTAQGFPVGIIDDETGEVYICTYRHSAPASALETANEVLEPLVGKKVAVQGLVYEKNNVNVIRMSIVSEY